MLKVLSNSLIKSGLLFVLWFAVQSVVAQEYDTSLDELAAELIGEYAVPGMSISVIKPDTIIFGVAGVRQMGKEDKVDLKSKFQIASNTKAITATIAAKLVEQGKISWETSIIDIVPELQSEIREEYYTITLQDFLSNRGNVQAFEDINSKEWKKMPKQVFHSTDSKLEFAKYALGLDPVADKTNDHYYSNGGFIIAGLMLERCSGQSWNELIDAFNQDYRINAVVGFPNQKNINETFGHKKRMGKYTAVSPDDELRFDFDFSPAGNLSLSIIDLSKFIQMHLNGLLGTDNILEAATYQKLHYGFDDYALGWYNGYIGNSEQRFSYHGGSLGTFSSAIMLSADRKVAIIILINSDDKHTTKLKTQVRETLWKKYGSQ